MAGEEGVHLENSRQSREGHENKGWLIIANSRAKLTLSRCSGRTKNVPCLGDGSPVYLRAATDTSSYSSLSCGAFTINHNNLLTVSEDVQFTSKEKKSPSLICAKLNQLRDSADLKPADESKDMVVVECQICSSGIAVLQDMWKKREESCLSLDGLDAKRGHTTHHSTNVGLSLH